MAEGLSAGGKAEQVLSGGGLHVSARGIDGPGTASSAEHSALNLQVGRILMKGFPLRDACVARLMLLERLAPVVSDPTGDQGQVLDMFENPFDRRRAEAILAA